MFKIDQVQKIREEDQKKLGRVSATADGIARQRATEIQEKAQSLKNKLQELVDKKGELFSSPISKVEVFGMLKEALAEGKKRWFMDSILIPHVKNVQIQRATPLGDSDFRVYSFSPETVWKLAYAVITEKDLEEAVATLPDIGLATAERNVQIKKIDMEIAALEGKIEKELKGV
jgi:hypothetical protein